MTRACETCEWWGRAGVVQGPFASDELIEVPAGHGVCVEGPAWERTTPNHWCSRWKLAERLAGGRDVRTTG